MKRYKPTYKTPRTYTDKRHFIFNRRKSKSVVPDTPDFFENDEDMELNSCSAFDCTGLIPSAVQNEAQAEAYESLYPYIAPAASQDGIN